MDKYCGVPRRRVTVCIKAAEYVMQMKSAEGIAAVYYESSLISNGG